MHSNVCFDSPRWMSSTSSRRHGFSTLLAITLLVLCGCTHRFQISQPAPPAIDPGSYSTDDYNADNTAYRAATTPASANADLAKQARNNIAYGLMTQIDVVYGNYYNQLFTAKNSTAVGFDVLTLGLSSAASIATHAATKTIFSALGTGFAGVSLSVDKNFFAQQTFPVIGVAMQTRRDKIRATIVSNLTLDTTAYPLLAAKRDLVAYLNAGTLASGLQELQEEAGSATAKSTTPATSKGPAAPTGLAAAPGDTQVSLIWAPSTGAASYNLYYSTTAGVTPSNGTKISGITTTSYTHSKLADNTALKNGTQYFYVVTAVNDNGESGASNQVATTPVAPGQAPVGAAPSAPTNLSAAPGNAAVTLAWSQSAGATSYNLYYSTTTGVTVANGTKISGITPPYTHSKLADNTPLKNGTKYYYIVTAVGASGESGPSNEASAAPTAGGPGEALHMLLTPH